MNSNAPQIGFDRFIQLDWLTCAIKFRAGFASMDELNKLLDAAGLGVAARKKTRTVLNRLWLEPRPELVDFANRGIEIYKSSPAVSVSALTWGMAMATYPFFATCTISLSSPCHQYKKNRAIFHPLLCSIINCDCA
jgi:hypothetical protein